MRIRNGWAYLGQEPVDHPNVHTYKSHGVKRYRAPLFPETIADLVEVRPELDEALREKQVTYEGDTYRRKTDKGADFWKKWAKRLQHTSRIKEKDPNSLDFDLRFIYPPYDHQSITLALSFLLPACGLFLETGTGKTHVALHNAQARLEMGLVDDVLIVAPQSILWTGWYEDIQKFTNLSSIIVHPTTSYPSWDCPQCDRSITRVTKTHAKDHWRQIRYINEVVDEKSDPDMRKHADADHLRPFTPKELEWNERRDISEKLQPGFDLYVTNPETVSNHLPAFLERGFDMIVLDESTMIKNPESQRGQAIIKLGQLADYRLAMTGTPVGNNLDDIWAQMYFLDQSLGHSITDFRNRYMHRPVPMEHPYFWVEQKGAKEKVVDRIKDRVIRFTKDECLDLPPRTEQVREVGLSNKSESHYRRMQDDLYTMVDDHEVVATTEMGQVHKLRQITNGFIIDEDEDVHLIDQKPPKLRETKRILQEITGKAIIWAYYKQDFAYLQEHLENPLTLNSDVSGARAREVERKFKEEDDYRVLIAHPESVKFGHTWNVATNVIYYSYSYSVLNYNQSRDRNYRIGQDSPVTEFVLIGSPVDEYLMESLKEGKDFGDWIANHESFRAAWDKFAL